MNMRWVLTLDICIALKIYKKDGKILKKYPILMIKNKKISIDLYGKSEKYNDLSIIINMYDYSISFLSFLKLICVIIL